MAIFVKNLKKSYKGLVRKNPRIQPRYFFTFSAEDPTLNWSFPDDNYQQ